jgi:hypothetical protein
MYSSEGPGEPEDSEAEEIRTVVPARAVLTELARGFLLVHESNPERAVRFADAFLKERAGRLGPTPPEPNPRVTKARLTLGRFPRGAVEPRPSSPGPGTP